MLLQTGGLDPAGGGLLAILVTFLLASVFYAITLHLAATFFLGDVPSQRAAYVAPVPAATSILLQQYGPAIAIAVTLFGDFVAILFSYGLNWRRSAVLAVLHFAFSVALIIPLNNIFGFV
jgi:hypothetical protein